MMRGRGVAAKSIYANAANRKFCKDMGHQHFLYARKVCKGQDSEGSSQKWALKGKIHQTEMLFRHAETALLL